MPQQTSTLTAYSPIRSSHSVLTKQYSMCIYFVPQNLSLSNNSFHTTLYTQTETDSN